MKKIFAVMMAVAALAFAHPAAAADYVLKFGHAASSKHPFHTGLEMFAKAVSEKTGGKVEIQVFGDRQLGDDKQLLEGIKLGTIDGALVSSPVLPLVIGAKAFDALQQPFVMTSYTQLADLLSGDLGQKLLATLDDKNIKGLGYIEAGQRHFLSREKAVKSIADFKGLKTRIVPIPLHKATWQAVGTNPIGMAYGEIFSGLETGTIDAVEINLSSVRSESLYQKAKQVTLTGHYFWPGVVMMSHAKFDALPEDVRTALIEAGHEVIKPHYDLVAALEKETTEFLKENGVTINTLSDLDEMRKLMEPVLTEWKTHDPLIAEFIAAAGGSK